MKDIDKMLKCRALFLQSVAYLNGENLKLDDNFNILLDSFLENYLEGNETYFNLIYYFSNDEDGNLVTCYDEEWDYKLMEYLNYFRTCNSEKVKAMYDDIGEYDVARISELASQFISYVLTLSDIGKTKIKS